MEEPAPPPKGLPEGAIFCGLIRWHRNELRPSGAIVNQAFPARISTAAKTKDQPVAIFSRGDGSEPLMKFENIRLGTTGGKWRISGATALVNSLSLAPEAKHVGLWRMTSPDERLFISGYGDDADGRHEGGAEPEQPKHKKAHKRQMRQERNRQLRQLQDTGGESSGDLLADGEDGELNGSPAAGLKRLREDDDEDDDGQTDAAALDGSDVAAGGVMANGTEQFSLQQELAAAVGSGPQCASRVAVTGHMREGGYLVLDPAFAVCASLSAAGPAHAASIAVQLLEPDGGLVHAVLALSVVPSDDGTADGSLVSAVVLGGLADWMLQRGVGKGSVVLVARTVGGLYYIAVESNGSVGDGGTNGISVSGADAASAGGASAGGLLPEGASQAGGEPAAAGDAAAPTADTSGGQAGGSSGGGGVGGYIVASGDPEVACPIAAGGELPSMLPRCPGEAEVAGQGESPSVEKAEPCTLPRVRSGELGAGGCGSQGQQQQVLMPVPQQQQPEAAGCGADLAGAQARTCSPSQAPDAVQNPSQAPDAVQSVWEQLFPRQWQPGEGPQSALPAQVATEVAVAAAVREGARSCPHTDDGHRRNAEAVAQLLPGNILSCTTSATHLLVAQLLAKWPCPAAGTGAAAAYG